MATVPTYPIVLIPEDALQPDLDSLVEACDMCPSKGVSEDNFFNLMSVVFDGNVHQNCALQEYDVWLNEQGNPINGNEEEGNRFYPDIIYLDKLRNLIIDIEIDEPYTGNDGLPIHYHGCRTDEYRNDCFTDRNWVVIRFAEEQIIKYPDACIRVIKDVVSYITGNFPGGIIEAFSSPSLKAWKNDMYVRCWSYEEAERMAKNRYRSSYLQELVKSIILVGDELYQNILILYRETLPDESQVSYWTASYKDTYFLLPNAVVIAIRLRSLKELTLHYSEHVGKEYRHLSYNSSLSVSAEDKASNEIVLLPTKPMKELDFDIEI